MAEVENKAEVEAEEASTKAKTKSSAKLSRYVCKRKCYWNGHLYDVGDELPAGTKNVPEHFEKM